MIENKQKWYTPLDTPNALLRARRTTRKGGCSSNLISRRFYHERAVPFPRSSRLAAKRRPACSKTGCAAPPTRDAFPASPSGRLGGRNFSSDIKTGDAPPSFRGVFCSDAFFVEPFQYKSCLRRKLGSRRFYRELPILFCFPDLLLVTCFTFRQAKRFCRAF